MHDTRVTRRRVLQLGAGMAATLLLAACGDDDDDDDDTGGSGSAQPTATTAAVATPTTQTSASTTTMEPASSPMADSASPMAGDGMGDILVGDVLDYSLEADGWDGPFGWVELKLHKGYFDGEDVWYIRTDASDQMFASEAGLVYVPLLANALQAEGSYAKYYSIGGDGMEHSAVITTVPTRDDFTSAFRVYNVTTTGDAMALTSEAAIIEAETAGTVEIEETDIIVNYPLVAWPGGSLPVDPELLEPLGAGPLVQEIDATGGTVRFKLHQCFPGSRYIVTDTSAVPMAPMMGIVGSAPTQLLKDAGATAPITIFLNGLSGPGVMGFQPAVFNTSAGDPAWSPFWDHYAVEWVDPAAAVVVRSQAELDELVDAGDLIRYNGLPDTHPNGFVVNCPSPILAENTYTGDA